MHSCFRAGPVISKVDSFWVIVDHVTWNRLSTSSQRTFWSGIDYWVTMFPLSSTLVKSADCAFRRRQKRVWCCGATWITESFAIRTLEVTGCASGFLTRTWLTRVPTTWMMDQRSLRKMESWFWRFPLPAQMGHAWIQAWSQNIHVFCTTNKLSHESILVDLLQPCVGHPFPKLSDIQVLVH